MDLQLDASWRITDWNAERDALEQAVSVISDRGTPKTKVFEAFLVLSRLQENAEKLGDLQRICDEGVQSALKAWYALPPLVSHSHIPVRPSLKLMNKIGLAKFAVVCGNSRGFPHLYRHQPDQCAK